MIAHCTGKGASMANSMIELSVTAQKRPLRADLPVICILGLGALVSTLNITLFNVAIPKMMEVFQTSITTAQWLSSSYLLALGMITPVAAFIGSRLGNRRVFLFCQMFCSMLVILGALSQTITTVIMVRFFFGLSAGLLLALSMAMIYQMVSPENQTMAISIWSVINMIGGVLPNCLTGIFISYFPWYFLLLFNLPFTLLALVAGLYFLPQDREKQSMSFDALGFVQLAAGSVLLLLAFSNMAVWGIGSMRFLLLLCIGCLSLGSYFICNLRKEGGSILHLSVFRYPSYTAAFVLDIVMTISLYTVTFLMPLYWQNCQEMSPLATGFILLPGAITTVLSLLFAGFLYQKKGAKVLAWLGLGIIVIGGIPFLNIWADTPVLWVILLMNVRSIGIGFMNLLTNNATMQAVPVELTDHASAMTNWTRHMCGALSTSVSSSLAGMILASGQASIGSSYAHSLHIFMAITMILGILCLPLVKKYL